MSEYWVCPGHVKDAVICRVGDSAEEVAIAAHRVMRDCLVDFRKVEAEP